MKKPGSQIFIDLETTGLNPNQDRICQVGAILSDGSEIDSLVNPHKNIPEEVTQLTGITNEMVKDAPDFEQVAESLIKGLENAEIFVAYNYVFDFQFLQNELFNRLQYDLKEEDFIFIDPYKVFRKMFPHTLSNAYKFYTGKIFEGAHSAINDIKATKEILEKQEESYPELFSKGMKEVEKETIGDTSILGKWFKKAKEGYSFKQGKHRGELVDLSHHEGYLKWIYKLEDVTLSEKRYISSILG